MFLGGRKLAVLGVVIALAGCGSHHRATPTAPTVDSGGDTPTPPQSQPAPSPTLAIGKILAFGDSVTEGTTSPAPPGYLFTAGIPDSYPYKLQMLEMARYAPQSVSVFNAGQASRRASDDRDRLHGAIADTSPDVVLLIEGANDLNNGEDIDRTVDALEDMVRDIVGRGIPVMLATLPPQRYGQKNSKNAASIPPLNDAIRAMAAKKGAMLVDLGAQVPLDMIGEDGLHPTAAGYDLIAQIFQTAIAAKWERAPEGFGSRGVASSAVGASRPSAPVGTRRAG